MNIYNLLDVEHNNCHHDHCQRNYELQLRISVKLISAPFSLLKYNRTKMVMKVLPSCIPKQQWEKHVIKIRKTKQIKVAILTVIASHEKL